MNERGRYIASEEEQVQVAERMFYFMGLEQEKEKPYGFQTSAENYQKDFGGLRQFLNYVERLSHPHILDIGAGEATAARELAAEYSSHLTFEATGLTPPTEPTPFPFHITTGEDLLGVRTASVGGILSRFSLAYSTNPEMVVDAIDRVLVPGGVFKGVFFNAGDFPPECAENIRLYYDEAFHDTFARQGFDVAHDGDLGIVLAKKPTQRKTFPANATSLYLAEPRTHNKSPIMCENYR